MRYPSSMLGLLALLLGVSPVFAQPTAAEIEASKKVAAEAANLAFDAFTNGKFEDAIAGFQKAEAAFHAPKFVLYVARAQVKLGRLLAAKTTYEGILKEQLPTYAPPEFFTAQADAKKELAELTVRIPTLDVRATRGITTVMIDGKPAARGQAIALDPGEHTLSGTGAGVPEVTKKVVLKEREARVETLEPPAVAPPPPTATPAGSSSASAGSGPVASTTASVGVAPLATTDPGPRGFFSTIPTGTYVAYGVGAAGLVLGGVFGGLTLAKKGDYDALRGAEPVDGKAVNQAAVDGQMFAIVSDVGFLVGILGAATGTVFWVLAPKGGDPKKTGAIPSVGVSPGGMTIRGAF